MKKSVIALVLLLSACVSMPGHYGVHGVSDRLYCGRSIPDGGGQISDAEIEQFLDEVVTPRFPEGFTAWTAEGNWKGEEEPTLVLEFLHPWTRRHDQKVREIAEEYRRRFRQESVMRVSSPAYMEFVEP